MSKRFVARRVAVAVATLAAIIVFNFFLFRALGDPSKDLIRGRLPPRCARRSSTSAATTRAS